VQGVSAKDLREMMNEQKASHGSGIVVMVADADGKAAVAVSVSDDLTARISAVDLVRAAAAELGGQGGGGRPEMAQAGGSDPSKADAAVAKVTEMLEAL